MLSYKNKIFIDRTFGMVAAFVVAVLARIVGLILHRDHTLPDRPKVIAVAKFVGLGSIVYTGILCRGLKNRFPHARLVYITGYSSLEFVKRINYIDEILYINDKSLTSIIKSTASLIFRLWRLRPVLYFDMEVYSSWAAIIATLSLALNRYGFYRKSADFKKGMHTHMIFFNTNQHISQIYTRMVLCVAGKVNNDLAGVLKVSREDRKACSKVLNEMKVGRRPVILVNTNASELLRERRWPVDKWVDYLEKSVYRFPEHVFILTGAPNEVEHASEISAKLSQDTRIRVINAAGKFNLGSFLALIKRACLMVTNDSGPFHFAVALGTPTVSIWGPGKPEHYGPISGIHKTIYKPVYCSPCLYHADFPPCQGNNICVKNIPVSSVIQATHQLLEIIEKYPPKEESKIRLLSKNDLIESTLIEVMDFNPVITHRKQKVPAKHYAEV